VGYQPYSFGKAARALLPPKRRAALESWARSFGLPVCGYAVAVFLRQQLHSGD